MMRSERSNLRDQNSIFDTSCENFKLHHEKMLTTSVYCTWTLDQLIQGVDELRTLSVTDGRQTVCRTIAT